MTRFSGRAAATIFFLATLSLVGNTGNVVNSCEALDSAHASSLLTKDPESHAIVRALRAVLFAKPAGHPGDLWQDLAADFQGISIANRARIQRFGEALHFGGDANAAQRKSAVVASIESIRLANSDLPAGEWVAFLELLDRAFGPANS